MLHTGEVVELHVPLINCPAEQLVVHALQAPAPEPLLNVPPGQAAQTGVAVVVQEPLRKVPAPQVEVHAMHEICEPLG